MSEQLTPSERTLADIERRLRNLETAPRVGLHRIRTAYATAAVDPVTFDAWESGAAGSTWADDAGNTGTGYAQLTVETGTKALVIFGCRVISLANNATYRCVTCRVGFGVNAVLPDGAIPTGQRTATNNTTVPGESNVAYSLVRRGLTPGPNTFRAYAFWVTAVPGAANLPRMTDTVLTVIPID